MRNEKLLLLVFIILFLNCKSSKNTNSVSFKKDIFMNISSNDFKNIYEEEILKNELTSKIKIIYKGKILEFNDFKKKENKFKDKEFSIIRDSLTIANYKVKDCNMLFIFKD